MKQQYFVCGIDTDIGKTIATGFLAKQFQAKQQSVITQKLVQTGADDVAQDVIQHRQIMQMPLNEDDLARLTMPEIFAYPASPHLAARLESREFDCDKTEQATQKLIAKYDVVLIEGAGGLFVPLREDYLLIDYIVAQNYPVILVTSGKLGSINHTLLSLEVLKARQIALHALVFNHIHDGNDPQISNETQRYLQKRLLDYYPQAQWIDLPVLAIK